MSRTSPTIANELHAPQRRGEVAGISQRLEDSLRSGELSDVDFAVGRDHGEIRIFAAHKYILSLSSDVFHTMFYGSLPERRKVIKVPDVLPEAFEIMLHFIYTDQINVTEENVCPLLCCADRYDLPLLVNECKNFIWSQIQADNCLFYLEMAIKWYCEDIVELCFNMVDAYSELAFKSLQFSSIAQETLHKLLQRNTLQVNENIIYTAVENWSAETCKCNNLEASAVNRRAVLGEALFHVRFPLLSPTELANGPALTGLLTEREQLDLYTYKLATTKPDLPFSTEPRMPQVFRIGHLEFQSREEVFVDHTGVWPGMEGFWVAAEAIGIHQAKVVVCLMEHTGRGALLLMEPGRVVRAADLLTRGRDIVCHLDLGPGIKRQVVARYQALDNGGHCVKVCETEPVRTEIIQFQDIFIRSVDVEQWKMKRESNAEKEKREGPAKKRLRN
ncbi:BTB/POZ domain-containing protein 3-like [Paramacrobiotus metropolitanus]|uniref:BTB/POZ domain-containing protein 3-like n=1 Tax=Paramacrobiotus metropolitanus TaxID=2943436 RepID=UPI002445E902|nr:BTB/POZ domain-containing protein 3-like [Paramacrobiotus metropolitanus]